MDDRADATSLELGKTRDVHRGGEPGLEVDVPAALERLEANDPAVHPFLDETDRRGRLGSTLPADGPLHGVAVGVKDLYRVDGLPTRGGSRLPASLFDGDESTIVRKLAVQGGWDTDCTGATAGSVFGAMHGTDALPGHWVDPLNDRVRSAIMGYDHSTLSNLTDRTLRLVRR